jgi:ferric-dicitrate binding protein FerR (iron transport regulator)
MSKPSGRSNDSEAETEHMLERIFAHVEPRSAPPADDMDEVRRALHAEWEFLVARRVWRRRAGVLAVAAAAVLALVVALRPNVSQVPTEAVARVERVQGVIGMRVGDGLAAGGVVVTGSGQVGLRLASGGSLRLARDTRVRLTPADGAQLMAGTVYFDSEGRAGNKPFFVTTEHGTVRDVGTQFLVRLAPEQLEVGVREGRIVLERAGVDEEASAGDKLLVGSADVGARREPQPTFGDEWAWVEQLAPRFDIDGRTLMEFLDWFERQTGRTVVFADPTAERIARETVLKGSIELEPLPKLAAVLTLTDLVYTLDGPRVVIATE